MHRVDVHLASNLKICTLFLMFSVCPNAFSFVGFFCFCFFSVQIHSKSSGIFSWAFLCCSALSYLLTQVSLSPVLPCITFHLSFSSFCRLCRWIEQLVFLSEFVVGFTERNTEEFFCPILFGVESLLIKS